MFGITGQYKSKNGPNLTILTRNFGSTAIWIGFDKGSFNQPKDKIGVAHFAEHMLIKESEGFPDMSLVNSELMALGVAFGAHTNLFSTAVKFNIPDPTDLEEVFDIFFDKIFKPSILESTIEKERNAIITELRSRKQDISGYSSVLLHNAILGINNTEWSFTGGKEEVIKSIHREDIEDYISKNYTLNNIRICIVGNIDINKTKNYINNKIASITDRKEKLIDDRKSDSLDNPIHLEMQNPDSSNGLRIIQEAFPLKIKTPKDAALFLLLRSYLTGSRSSHLSQVLRTEKGLVYGVGSWSIYSQYSDFLCLSYEVATENFSKFTKEKKNIYSQLANGNINNILFEATKNHRSKVVNRWFESSDLLLEHWITYMIANKEFGFDEIHRATKEATLKDFTNFATKIFLCKKTASVEIT